MLLRAGILFLGFLISGIHSCKPRQVQSSQTKKINVQEGADVLEAESQLVGDVCSGYSEQSSVAVSRQDLESKLQQHLIYLLSSRLITYEFPQFDENNVEYEWQAALDQVAQGSTHRQVLESKLPASCKSGDGKTWTDMALDHYLDESKTYNLKFTPYLNSNTSETCYGAIENSPTVLRAEASVRTQKKQIVFSHLEGICANASTMSTMIENPIAIASLSDTMKMLGEDPTPYIHTHCRERRTTGVMAAINNSGAADYALASANMIYENYYVPNSAIDNVNNLSETQMNEVLTGCSAQLGATMARIRMINALNEAGAASSCSAEERQNTVTALQQELFRITSSCMLSYGVTGQIGLILPWVSKLVAERRAGFYTPPEGAVGAGRTYLFSLLQSNDSLTEEVAEDQYESGGASGSVPTSGFTKQKNNGIGGAARGAWDVITKPFKWGWRKLTGSSDNVAKNAVDDVVGSAAHQADTVAPVLSARSADDVVDSRTVTTADEAFTGTRTADDIADDQVAAGGRAIDGEDCKL